MPKIARNSLVTESIDWNNVNELSDPTFNGNAKIVVMIQDLNNPMISIVE